MKTVQRFVCEKCGFPIEPENGFIVQGNVYVVKEEITDRAGIIGNMFPEPNDKGLLKFDNIKEEAWHSKCLLTYLNFSLERDEK